MYADNYGSKGNTGIFQIVMQVTYLEVLQQT